MHLPCYNIKMANKQGFSRFLSLIFAALCLSAGAGVFWYYSVNMQKEGANGDSAVKSGAANISANGSIASPEMRENGAHIVTLSTTLGDISFETYDADAPKAVNNFLALSRKGFYDNVIFHRVIKGFMIQGGDPLGTGTGGPGYAFEDELNPEADSYKAGYKKGVVAMANAGPNTNGSQFFIMLEDYPLQRNYTIFGKVVRGQDVVDKIGSLSTDPRNDRPLSPPAIKSVKIEER